MLFMFCARYCQRMATHQRTSAFPILLEYFQFHFPTYTVAPLSLLQHITKIFLIFLSNHSSSLFVYYFFHTNSCNQFSAPCILLSISLLQFHVKINKKTNLFLLLFKTSKTAHSESEQAKPAPTNQPTVISLIAASSQLPNRPHFLFFVFSSIHSPHFILFFSMSNLVLQFLLFFLSKPSHICFSPSLDISRKKCQLFIFF